MDMPNVIQRYFRYQEGPDCIKACHLLERTGKNISIIIRFVYVSDENEIYEGQKFSCAGQLNDWYANERLPEGDIEICSVWLQTAKILH